MKVLVMCAIGALLLNACSSDDAKSECPDIAGNYSATATRASGTCDPSVDPKSPTSFAIARNTDGSYTVMAPGIAGGCPGQLDAACKLRSACEVRGADGALVLTTNLDYAFTSSGYTGTSVSGISPPTVAARCEVTYRETGTKL